MSNNIKKSVIKKFLSSLHFVKNRISLNDFIDRILQAFNLSNNDKRNSSIKPTDPMAEQKVRNLTSRNDIPDGVS